MEAAPGGIITFLFSDIEDSTRRWREDANMAELLARHDEILRAAISTAGGHWTKHTGDGVLAAFDSAGAAIRAAVDIQRRLEGADDLGLRVRIGIHTGEATRRDNDYFGFAVNSAARVMDAGHGGQILVTEATKALLGDGQPGIGLIDLGRHRLKDLGEPHRLFQVQGQGLDDDFPPLRTLDAVNHNLPLQLTSFIGREDEREDVSRLVREHRLVTLTGVGGAGKTRLSLQVAADLVADFTDGVCLVELAPVIDPEAVPTAIAGALGIRREKTDPSDVTERIVAHLQDRSLLLVVDNCEHVLGAAARVITTILERAHDVTVLASSREGLSIRGERLYQVPSLHTTGNGADSEAAQLFADRARAVSPSFELNAETIPAVDRICRLLDGIPLAIELAAARTRVLSPALIGERLDDRFRLLKGGSRMAMPRQQTLEAAVDWSYQLLTDGERQLFERLSVFVGGFSLEAAERVCSDDEVDEFEVLDLLESLVDKSMVVADLSDAGVSRYRMLETLRQFGYRRLGQTDESLRRWRTRHLQFFTEELEDHSPVSWDAPSHLEWYGIEAGNLTVALEWAERERPDAIPMLSASVGYHLVNNAGDPDEALRRFEQAIEAATPDSSMALRLETFRLVLFAILGEVDRLRAAWGHLEPVIAAADDEDAAWAFRRVAIVFAQDPELDASVSIELAREAVRRSESLGTEPQLDTLDALAWSMLWSNADSDTLMDVLDTAVSLARDRDDEERLLRLLSTLALACHTSDQRSDTDLTDAVEDEMLELWEHGGRSSRQEYVMWIGIRRGMWDLAEWEIDAQARELEGNHRVQYLMARGVLRWMQGRYDEANRDFDDVAQIAPIRRWHHDYYPARAEVAALTGHRDLTRSWVERHFDVALEPAEEVMRLGTLRALAMAHVDAGDLDSARSTLERMRSIAGQQTAIGIPTVQIGSEAFYLASAEAELSRLTGADPAVWQRARGEAFWVFWRHYCEVRELGARAALGEAVGDRARRLREELTDLGELGLVGLLERELG